MPVIDPMHLLDQADAITRSQQLGAPRQTNLRRAISNAYYALFHAILTAVADDIVGKSKRATVRYSLVYRSVEHRVLRRLCDELRKDKLPARLEKYFHGMEVPAQFKDLCGAFIDLYEKRHLADYDPLYRTGTSDAIAAVASSRRALVALTAPDSKFRKTFSDVLLFGNH